MLSDMGNTLVGGEGAEPLEGLWAVSETQGRKVFDIYLDSLAGDGHRHSPGVSCEAGSCP